MTLLERTVREIKIPDTKISEGIKESLKTHHNIDFGRLSDALVRYIRITGERHPALPQTSVVISCADHGVAAESVSAYPPETTLNMMCNYLIAHGGAANAVANYANANLIVADLGVDADTAHIPGLLHRSIARGTANMTQGAAMTRAQAIQSVETGIELVHLCAERGDRCILPGEMGISNTTSSAAIVAAVLGLSPEEVTGRGANISDARLAHKIEIVRRALTVNTPNPKDGLDVLSKVGGFELGCIAGIILGAAARRMLVVLDGANTTSAALIAHALAPECAHYLLASHGSLSELSQPHALHRLGLPPMLRLDIRLSEAAGSSIALDFLKQMLCVWDAVDTDAMHANEMPPAILGDTEDADESDYIRLKIPTPDDAAAEACLYRLDNLAKPLRSLGYLEWIAVKLAGAMRMPQPPTNTKAALILAVRDGALPAAHHTALAAMCAYTGIPIYLLPLPDEITDRARARIHRCVRRLADRHPLLMLGMEEDGSPDLRIATTIMSAAADAHSLVIPADAAAEERAYGVGELYRAVAPYILHIFSDMIKLDAAPPTGTAGPLAVSIIRAALHALNDMKTFTEANVAVAIDGAGAGRQVREEKPL